MHRCPRSIGSVLLVALLVLVAHDAAAQSPPGSDGAKAMAKCQRTIAKVNAKFLAQRLKHLAVCSNGVLGCLQTQPGVAKCIAKATEKCRKQLGTPEQPDAAAAKLEAAVVKACGGLPVADLLAEGGLGFSNAEAACAGVDVTSLAGVADVAQCLRLLHAGLSEESFGSELPRAAELTGQGGVSALVVPALPVFGGCGDCGTAPPPTGKLVTGCAGAINKAGAAFLAKARGGLDKCANALVGCAQTKPGDAGCLAKAKATCEKLPADLAKGRDKLFAALAKKCGGALPFATLDAPAGINLGALACACQNVGVQPVATLDDYGVCLARQHECALASLLPWVAPSVDGLLSAQGLAVDDLLCPPAATAAFARSTPHAITVFGKISKFLSGIFPAQPKTTALPFAKQGTAPRVGRPSVSGGCKPAPGRTCAFRFPIRKTPLHLKSAGRGGGVPPALIIAVQRADGTFAEDHFELDLGDTSVDTEIDLNVTYANDLASCKFDLALSVVENGEAATYTKVDQQPHVRPENDECFTPRLITGDAFTDVVDTTEATSTDGDPFPTCAVSGLSRTVWYSFTAPANGIITADTFGSDFDTLLAVWTGANCSTLSQATCANDSGGSPQSKIAMPVQQGVTYLIQAGADVDPADASTLHFALHFQPAGTPPTASKPTIALDELNTCDLPEGLASFFRVDVDFVDPDGDVLPGTTAAQVHFEFRPLNNGGDFPVDPVFVTVSGDGFAGHASFFVCYRFADQTSVDTTVRLVDVAGEGNAVTVKMNRPAGAF